MICDTYRIIDRGNVIASGMPIETALILLKALFTEYWADLMVCYTIEKEPRSECEAADMRGES